MGSKQETCHISLNNNIGGFKERATGGCFLLYLRNKGTLKNVRPQELAGNAASLQRGRKEGGNYCLWSSTTKVKKGLHRKAAMYMRSLGIYVDPSKSM